MRVFIKANEVLAVAVRNYCVFINRIIIVCTLITCYCDCVYDYGCFQHTASFPVYVYFYLTRGNIHTD